jgi:PEP-CTERM motif
VASRILPARLPARPRWLIEDRLRGANDTDSGAQVGGNCVYQGSNGSYYKEGEGAFNLVTDYTIAAGDLFTLTYYTYNTFPGGSTIPQSVWLFSQANPSGASYSYTPVATLATDSENLVNGNSWTEYSLTYTATGAVAGNDIGVAIQNNSTGSSDYTAADNFTLTVTPAAVPEPSTYALIGAGIVGFVLVRRFRHASV